VSANADRWRKLWCEIQGRVREMALLGCRPSVALTGLAMLAHSRENELTGIKSSRNALRNGLRNSPVQAMNKSDGATASTPGEKGQALAWERERARMVAARFERRGSTLRSTARYVTGTIPQLTGTRR
jgi:hypothetical protein